METPILIFGTEAKARVALEIFQSNGIMVYGLLSEEKISEEGARCGHVPVLGHMEEQTYLDLLGEKCNAFVAFEGIEKCKEVVAELSRGKGLHPLNAVHAFTNLSKGARLGGGNIIHTGSSIGSEVTIHNHTTLMGHNMVGYGATLHDFVYVGANATIHPGATVHEEAYIGSGAIIGSNVTIGAQARITTGAIVLEDVAEGAIVSLPRTSLTPTSKKHG